jgi:hypothetical protein
MQAKHAIRVVGAVAALLIPLLAVKADTLDLPGEQDVAGMQKLCGAGTMDAVSLNVDLDAAIKNWKNASVNAGLEPAKINIAAAIGRVKDEQHLTGMYQIYVNCVSDSLQKFLDNSARRAPTTAASPVAGPPGFVKAEKVTFLFNQCDRYEPERPANYLPHSCCLADGTRVATGLTNPDPEYHGSSAVPIGAKCVALSGISKTYVSCIACTD